MTQESVAQIGTSYSAGHLLAVVSPGTVLVLDAPADWSLAGPLWELALDDAPIDEILDVLVRRGVRTAPSFAIVRRERDAVRTLVRGSVPVCFERDGDPVRLDATGAATWLEGLISGARRVLVGAVEVDAELPYRVDSGVVLVSGLAVPCAALAPDVAAVDDGGRVLDLTGGSRPAAAVSSGMLSGVAAPAGVPSVAATVAPEPVAVPLSARSVPAASGASPRSGSSGRSVAAVAVVPRVDDTLIVEAVAAPLAPARWPTDDEPVEVAEAPARETPDTVVAEPSAVSEPPIVLDRSADPAVAPVEPAVLDSEPVEPEPVEPEPVDSEPVDSEPVDSEPVDSELLDAGSSRPELSELLQSESIDADAHPVADHLPNDDGQDLPPGEPEVPAGLDITDAGAEDADITDAGAEDADITDAGAEDPEVIGDADAPVVPGPSPSDLPNLAGSALSIPVAALPAPELTGSERSAAVAASNAIPGFGPDNEARQELRYPADDPQPDARYSDTSDPAGSESTGSEANGPGADGTEPDGTEPDESGRAGTDAPAEPVRASGWAVPSGAITFSSEAFPAFRYPVPSLPGDDFSAPDDGLAVLASVAELAPDPEPDRRPEADSGPEPDSSPAGPAPVFGSAEPARDRPFPDYQAPERQAAGYRTPDYPTPGYQAATHEAPDSPPEYRTPGYRTPGVQPTSDRPTSDRPTSEPGIPAELPSGDQWPDRRNHPAEDGVDPLPLRVRGQSLRAEHRGLNGSSMLGQPVPAPPRRIGPPGERPLGNRPSAEAPQASGSLLLPAFFRGARAARSRPAPPEPETPPVEDRSDPAWPARPDRGRPGGQPDTGRPGPDQPGSGQPGSGQPGSGHPEAGQPGSGQSAPGQRTSWHSPARGHQSLGPAAWPADNPGTPSREFARLSQDPPREPPRLLGVWCDAGHVTSPDRASCRVCGLTVPQQAPILVARPPLGVLIFDSGDRVVIDRPVILGRDPRPVASSDPEPPVLHPVVSRTGQVSRTHAELRAEGWDVVITDLDAMNGTALTAPGMPPIAIEPGAPTVISPGSRVDLGGEVGFVFEVES